MTNRPHNHPFGFPSSEQERAKYKDKYKDLYFRYTPFGEFAMSTDHYLYVGRRGTGKTTLSAYFTFQSEFPNARCIDVDEPQVFADVLEKIEEIRRKTGRIRTEQVVEIWRLVLWQLLIVEHQDLGTEVNRASWLLDADDSASGKLKKIVKHLFDKIISDESGKISDQIEEHLLKPQFRDARDSIILAARRRPVIIAIDTLEKYATDDHALTTCVAALIQAAADLWMNHSTDGIHIKLFIAAEIFPYIRSTAITNTLKYIVDPVFLQWRPKDLMRLMAWRFYAWTQIHSIKSSVVSEMAAIDWTSNTDVIKKAWEPLFGRTVVNSRQVRENSFAYVLRHTQLRPRQFVIICNNIFNQSRYSSNYSLEQGSTFPFDANSLVDGVRKSEISLSDEVLNAYEKIYPNIAQIVSVLAGFEILFRANALDRVAARSQQHWQPNTYSSLRFRQVMAELGIVGRVRQQNSDRLIISADFEYNMEDQLTLSEFDMCVIHPMFLRKLNIRNQRAWVIYPFPPHRDYDIEPRGE